MNLSEAEIHSLTRKFFLTNDFRVVSRTPGGEEIHYRISTNASKYKIPDSVSFKKDLIIVSEQKLRYSDLFSSGTIPDIDKICQFLSNKNAVNEFKKSMLSFNEISSNPNIVGGFSSLIPQSSKYQINSNKVYIGIEKISTKFKVSLIQDGGYASYFPKISCILNI